MLASATNSWWSPFRVVDDISVLYVDLSTHAAREAEAFEWLNDDERGRQGRYLHEGPRRRFALCRAALRAVLCNRLGCTNEQLTFGAFEFGKPYAVLHGDMAPVSFNVSHSGDHGLIALAAEGWVGVDVEERVARRNLDDLIETVLSPDERAELESSDERIRLDGFLRLWTIKESLAKAVGIGVSLDLSDLEAPLTMRRGAQGGVFQFPQMPDVRWRLEDLSTESFAAAVAHELGAAPGAEG